MNFEETCSTRPGQWTGANVMGMLLSQVRSKLPTIPNPRLTTTSTVKQKPNINTSEGTDMGERDANKIACQGNTTDQKEKNVLTIIGDSMIRNVYVKPQETEVRKFTMSGARIEDIENR